MKADQIQHVEERIGMVEKALRVQAEKKRPTPGEIAKAADRLKEIRSDLFREWQRQGGR